MNCWFDVPLLSDGEARLEHDSVFGWMDYPEDFQTRDDYFRDGLALVLRVEAEHRHGDHRLRRALRVAHRPGDRRACTLRGHWQGRQRPEGEEHARHNLHHTSRCGHRHVISSTVNSESPNLTVSPDLSG